MNKILQFNYKNWKGEIENRRIDTYSINIYYGEVEWHKGEQWLLKAFDLKKNDFRTFAIKDILSNHEEIYKEIFK